jgi:beta-galactosidase/beta-glucuronidase
VDAAVRLSRPLLPGQALNYRVFDPAGRLAAQVPAGALTQRLSVPSPALWDLEAPNLYSLRVTLSGGDQPEDGLSTEFGFRTISTEGGRLLLNGRPIYLRAALDQDYYPDLIYTPPSSEYLEAQLRQAKAMGLNCLRLHIKIGDPRYYAAADRLGLLIWTELPNWQRLTPAAAERARATLEGMVARDWNHPSIIVWTIINECWGLDLTQPGHRAWLAEAYTWLKQLDPHRLVVGNSACGATGSRTSPAGPIGPSPGATLAPRTGALSLRTPGTRPRAKPRPKCAGAATSR